MTTSLSGSLTKGTLTIKVTRKMSNQTIMVFLVDQYSMVKQRVQCNGPAEVCSSMQHDMIEDNNLPLSREKNGEHDSVTQLLIQRNSSSLQDLVIHVIHSVPEARKTRDRKGEISSRLEQQGTRNQQPHPVSLKRRRTSSLKVKITKEHDCTCNQFIWPSISI